MKTFPTLVALVLALAGCGPSSGPCGPRESVAIDPAKAVIVAPGASNGSKTTSSTTRCRANTEALVAYRRAHGYPLYTWQEQYYGDITGIEGLLGPDPAKKK